METLCILIMEKMCFFLWFKGECPLWCTLISFEILSKFAHVRSTLDFYLRPVPSCFKFAIEYVIAFWESKLLC